jgi:hypothetical protein
MTVVLIALVAVLAATAVTLATAYVRQWGRVRSHVPVAGARRILFPFVAEALSPSALDAALRLASTEQATLVPVFLARVSLDLPLETPLPQQSQVCLPLQEAIEQRATRVGVPVDARIERGRTYRHALRHAIAHQRFERIVIAAATENGPGFAAIDVRWLLDNAPGEIIVLRPSENEEIAPPAPLASPDRAQPAGPRGTHADAVVAEDGRGPAHEEHTQEQPRLAP